MSVHLHSYGAPPFVILHRNDPCALLLARFVLKQKQVGKLKGKRRTEDHPSGPGELHQDRLANFCRTGPHQLQGCGNLYRVHFREKARQSLAASRFRLRERWV